jgi:hypothetical protein
VFVHWSFDVAFGLQDAGALLVSFVLSWAWEVLAAWSNLVALVWGEAVFNACALAVCQTFLIDLLWWHLWILRIFGWHLAWDFFGFLAVLLLADGAACTWLFEWSFLLFVAGLDDGAALAVVDSQDLIVQTLMFNAVWVDWILPDGTGQSEVTSSIDAVAVIVGGDAGCSVEESTMCALAAVRSLDTLADRSDGVADLRTAESLRVAVWFWMFKEWIAALDEMSLFDWTVLADFWILIDAVWTVNFTVTVDLLVQRAQGYARRAAGILQFDLHLVLRCVALDCWAACDLTDCGSWSGALAGYAVGL